jgi:hypothetical protein
VRAVIRPPTTSGLKGEKKMKVKANVKAGKIALNHNQTGKGLRVKSSVKAGGIWENHSQTVAR